MVCAQIGTWRDADDEEVAAQKPVATHYRVSQMQVAYVARFDDLKGALENAGLTEQTEA